MLEETDSKYELVQRWIVAFLCIWLASAILPPLSLLLHRCPKTILTSFMNSILVLSLLFRCASMSSEKNVETGGGGEEREERERKSKMFDTVFVPTSASSLTTVS